MDGARPAAAVVDCTLALQALQSFDAIIDVRSPSEFAEDHIPGALNFPVLDDAERALIGTMHKQESAFAARKRGAALVAANIARHLQTPVFDQPRDWRPLVYCWRGGQRSGAMTHVLGRIGWHAQQLDGGYRAYRRSVLVALETLPLPLEFRVICGTTGSGKSRLLQSLRQAGAQVLDLEDVAQHRGSVLGDLPKAPQPSQKWFESQLWDALRRLDPARPVFVESESRKIGSLRLPQALIDHMRAAPCIVVTLPLHERVRLLRQEYAHFEDDAATLGTQLDCLTALHGRERISLWKTLAADGRWDEMVERLLVEHYDPAYVRSIERNFRQVGTAVALSLPSADADAFELAARDLAAMSPQSINPV
jgi:tRNA 2-selenouridine synthase